MKESGSIRNPLAVFEKVWRVAERIAMASACVLVMGTAGYVGYHILA